MNRRRKKNYQLILLLCIVHSIWFVFTIVFCAQSGLCVCVFFCVLYIFVCFFLEVGATGKIFHCLLLFCMAKASKTTTAMPFIYNIYRKWPEMDGVYTFAISSNINGLVSFI